MISKEAIMHESWNIIKKVSPQLPYHDVSFQFGAHWMQDKLIEILAEWSTLNRFNIEDQAGAIQIVIDYDELIKFINTDETDGKESESE